MTKSVAFAASLFATVSIASSAMALRGLPSNGPELTGVPAIVGQTAEDDVVNTPYELDLLTFNGPELTGTQVIVEEAEFIPGIGSCAPWQCGVNGPELTGVEIRSHAGGPRVEDFEHVASEEIRF